MLTESDAHTSEGDTVMEILSAFKDGIQFFGFVGQCDTTDVEEFQAHIEEAVNAQHFKVVLNLGRLTFINSTAIWSLIRAQKRLNQNGGDLAVAELDGFPGSVFETLGLDRKIRCFASEAEAVSYLKRWPPGEAGVMARL